MDVCTECHSIEQGVITIQVNEECTNKYDLCAVCHAFDSIVTYNEDDLK